MFVQSTDSLQIYYQLEGSADLPVLVLVHGFYGSLQDWYEYGYVDALQKEYHLVLIEVRGHGMSGKPTNPAAYSHDPTRTGCADSFRRSPLQAGILLRLFDGWMDLI